MNVKYLDATPLRNAQDIDLWFEDLNDPKLAQALKKMGAAYVPPFGFNTAMLAWRGAEPFDVAHSPPG